MMNNEQTLKKRINSNIITTIIVIFIFIPICAVCSLPTLTILFILVIYVLYLHRSLNTELNKTIKSFKQFELLNNELNKLKNNLNNKDQTINELQQHIDKLKQENNELQLLSDTLIDDIRNELFTKIEKLEHEYYILEEENNSLKNSLLNQKQIN